MTEDTRNLPVPTQLKQALTVNHLDKIRGMLPKYVSPDKFINVALLAATKNQKLQECTFESIILGVLESARAGLHLDNKQATLIPYRQKRNGQWRLVAQWMPMVQGIIDLMLRTPGVQKVEARVVREGDEFDYRYGLNQDLIHKPLHQSEGRELTHAYAIVWMRGTTMFEVVDQATIEQARAASQAPDGPAWTEWESEMWRKVAVKRLAKYIDLTDEARRVIAMDHEIYGSENIESQFTDGLSEDYETFITRTRTEENLENLKASLNDEDEDEDEPQDEDEDEIVEGEFKDDGEPGERPWKPAQVKRFIAQQVEEFAGSRRDEKFQNMQLWEFAVWMIDECFPGDPNGKSKREAVTLYLFSKDNQDIMTGAEARATMKWLSAKKDERGDYKPSKEARGEARSIVVEQLREATNNNEEA